MSDWDGETNYAEWLARQPKPKTMAEAFSQLPPGVTGFMLDPDKPEVLHNAIAEAVGETTRLYQYRWRAVITYIDGSHDSRQFDEFHEFGNMIEHGPNWNLIGTISIHLNKHIPIGSKS